MSDHAPVRRDVVQWTVHSSHLLDVIPALQLHLLAIHSSALPQRRQTTTDKLYSCVQLCTQVCTGVYGCITLLRLLHVGFCLGAWRRHDLSVQFTLNTVEVDNELTWAVHLDTSDINTTLTAAADDAAVSHQCHMNTTVSLLPWQPQCKQVSRYLTTWPSDTRARHRTSR